MAADERTSDVADLAAEAVAPIGEELRERLAAELDERDRLAVESALLKAFLNGMGAALAETPEPVIDEGVGFRQLGPARVEPALGGPALELPQLDPWAQRYGEDWEAR
ncbi:MAG TPA: hypothetical protein VL979_00245 [Solirubrobacteraceae bacterium]|nr:hypothetical protein [Solirubrobacteraceae bacterium]